MNPALWMIIISAFLNAFAQVLLKTGVHRIEPGLLASSQYFKTILAFSFNPLIVVGTFCYVLSLFFWLRVLSQVDLSYGVPILSLSYVFTALAGVFFFAELLTFSRIIGIGFILGGIYLVSQTA